MPNRPLQRGQRLSGPRFSTYFPLSTPSLLALKNRSGDPPSRQRGEGSDRNAPRRSWLAKSGFQLERPDTAPGMEKLPQTSRARLRRHSRPRGAQTDRRTDAGGKDRAKDAELPGDPPGYQFHPLPQPLPPPRTAGTLVPTGYPGRTEGISLFLSLSFSFLEKSCIHSLFPTSSSFALPKGASHAEEITRRGVGSARRFQAGVLGKPAQHPKRERMNGILGVPQAGCLSVCPAFIHSPLGPYTFIHLSIPPCPPGMRAKMKGAWRPFTPSRAPLERGRGASPSRQEEVPGEVWVPIGRIKRRKRTP